MTTTTRLSTTPQHSPAIIQKRMAGQEFCSVEYSKTNSSKIVNEQVTEDGADCE